MIEHRIFKPDLLLQDFVNSSWCDNIRTIDGKLPVSTFLKNRGILSLEISPLHEKEWYGFGLPVNKNWEAENFKQTMVLSFSVYSEVNMCFDVIFQNDKNENSKPTIVKIEATSKSHPWHDISVTSPINNIRMVLFSGPAHTPNYVIKDIVLKSTI